MPVTKNIKPSKRFYKTDFPFNFQNTSSIQLNAPWQDLFPTVQYLPCYLNYCNYHNVIIIIKLLLSSQKKHIFLKSIDVLQGLLEVLVEISSFCFETFVTISHSKEPNLWKKLFFMKSLNKQLFILQHNILLNLVNLYN